MKTIGILGGMSAESTQLYYSELCRITRERLGGLHSPQLLIRALDFAEIEALQSEGDWNAAGQILNHEAKAIERGGADLVLLATNTMHNLADDMMTGVTIPLLHIADTTAQAIRLAGFQKPGLMATAFTMEQSFYTDRLTAAGLTPVVPNADDRAQSHRIIYNELCKGIMTKTSEATYIEIAKRLGDAGAGCLILRCTEVGILLHEQNVPLSVFDTMHLHCVAAIEHALLSGAPS